MQKYAFCLLLLIGAVYSQNLVSEGLLVQPSLPLCPGIYECSTPSGCWTSCSDPRFGQCGDVFPLLYNPSFCAYTKDGRYVNYTFECQACKNTEVVAVRSGACSCDFLKCGANQVCQNGECVDLSVNLCLTVKCSAGYFC